MGTDPRSSPARTVLRIPSRQAIAELWIELDTLLEQRAGEQRRVRVQCEQGRINRLNSPKPRINGFARDGELPVLYLEAPVAGYGLTQLFGDGLAKMDWPSAGADHSVETRFYARCIEKRVRLIIIDEAGRLEYTQEAGPPAALGEQLKLPIVAASAEGRWFKNDDHLWRRFEPLHRFGPYRGEDLLNLMACVEAHLPFAFPSYLDELDRREDRDGALVEVPGIASRMGEWTGGRINKVCPSFATAPVLL